MLTREAEALWQKYLGAENDRIRVVTLAALDQFIDLLLRQEDEDWKAWARGFAAQVSDGSLDVPVRGPLFRRVLLPALAEGVMRGEAGCARWLAYLASSGHVVNTNDVPLPGNLRLEAGLLSEAVRLDPADGVARTRLVERMASDLEYSLHELPAGVLYGSNGATAEECDDLLRELEQFRSNVAVLHQEEAFQDLIAECELHFKAYREYLLSHRSGDSYERFLSSRGLKHDRRN